MYKQRKSPSPSRRNKEFDLYGNVYQSKLPSYDGYHDPHLENFFLTKSRKSIEKNNSPHQIYQIYNSNKSLSLAKHREKQKTPRNIEKHMTPKLPALGKQIIVKKKIKPITAEQFKKILIKYRGCKSSGKNLENYATDRGFVTS
jgi:hypothetical protein